MLNINTNYAASFASKAATSAQRGLDSAMEKLSVVQELIMLKTMRRVKQLPHE